MRMLVGARVDLTNLYWIYRARRFFGMSPEEALTLILKARYRADFDILTKFAFAEPDAMDSVLAGTMYSGIFEFGEEDAKSIALREMRLESRVSKTLLSAAERVFISGSQGFQNVVAYMTLKEFEIRDITAIMESVRYGFDKNKTAMFLIRTLGSLGKEMS
jgi:V/A-type H+-transporting ATPase subunit C